MSKEKRHALFILLAIIFSTYRIYRSIQFSSDLSALSVYLYIGCGWCLFVGIFCLCMEFLKGKSEFMRKLDENGKSILGILTLVLGNDYLFFLSTKMAQQSGIETPLSALNSAISYIIIATALVTIRFIVKIQKGEI